MYICKYTGEGEGGGEGEWRVINPVYHRQEYKRPLIASPSCAHCVPARANGGALFKNVLTNISGIPS